MPRKITIHHDVASFLWNFFTRWQAFVTAPPTAIAIEFWERATGRTIDPRLFFSLMIGLFSLVSFFVMWRKERQNAGKVGVTSIFDRLLMAGYELGPEATDSWLNNCVEFLERLFGQGSYEVRVFKKEAQDPQVNQRFSGYVAKLALLKGGKLSPLSSLLRDQEGTITFHIVALRWAAERFESGIGKIAERTAEDDDTDQANLVVAATFLVVGLIAFTLMRAKPIAAIPRPAPKASAIHAVSAKRVLTTEDRKVIDACAAQFRLGLEVDYIQNLPADDMPVVVDASDYVQKKGIRVFRNDPVRGAVFRGVRCDYDLMGPRLVVGLRN